MLNNLLERPEAQDAGTIILTGFEPEIVLSSVRTVIEEFKKEFSQSNAKYSADLSAEQAGSRKENTSARN